jgi:hypothetical protein
MLVRATEFWLRRVEDDRPKPATFKVCSTSPIWFDWRNCRWLNVRSIMPKTYSKCERWDIGPYTIHHVDKIVSPSAHGYVRPRRLKRLYKPYGHRFERGYI